VKVDRDIEAALAGKGKLVEETAMSWEEDLGLYWSDVLYFDFGQ
jgi:hypothetical protein